MLCSKAPSSFSLGSAISNARPSPLVLRLTSAYLPQVALTTAQPGAAESYNNPWSDDDSSPQTNTGMANKMPSDPKVSTSPAAALAVPGQSSKPETSSSEGDLTFKRVKDYPLKRSHSSQLSLMLIAEANTLAANTPERSNSPAPVPKLISGLQASKTSSVVGLCDLLDDSAFKPLPKHKLPPQRETMPWEEIRVW